MVAIQPLVAEFTIVGKLEDFVVSSHGRLRHLYLSTSESEYSIEVVKSRQAWLTQGLQQGCTIQVSGMRKNKLHKGQIEYKAYRIQLLAPPTEVKSAVKKTKSTTAQILVCQGSKCRQQGGAGVCQLLRAELAAQGKAEGVNIKTTGCMKQCKQGPHLVITPGRNRYSGLRSSQIAKIVQDCL